MSQIDHYAHFSWVHGNVHVDVDLSPTVERLKQAQAWLGDRVLEDSRAIMPIRTGGLQQRSHTEDGGRRVIFPGPYARYLYGGKVMVDSVTGKGPMKIPVAPGEYILRFRKGATLVPTSRPLTYSSPQAVPEWFEEAKRRHGNFWIEGVKEIVGGK